MATYKNYLSPQRKSAFIAGISLIIMAIVAAFSYGHVQGSLVVQGDAATTYNNIRSSINLFGAGILGWLIILICDILVAWSLYIFLKPIHHHLALLGAWLRLTYAAILGVAIVNLVFIFLLGSSIEYSSLVANESQIHALFVLFLQVFHFIWSIGLIIFGVHLLVVCYVVFHSDYIPKVFSILLFIASVGYITEHLFSAFMPQYDGILKVLEIAFTVPMIIGELGFGLWLLFKGGKNSTT